MQFNPKNKALSRELVACLFFSCHFQSNYLKIKSDLFDC